MAARLNRDARASEMKPVDHQARRLLWHQICFLDLLTSDAQGSQPVIRDNEFDTPLPQNIKDDAFDWPNKESIPTLGWTDVTFSIIRYECCMVHRLILTQRLAMENGQTDYKTIQHLIYIQKIRMERQYFQYLDETVPIQRCAKQVGQLFIARLEAMLLQRHPQVDINLELQTDVREKYVRPIYAKPAAATSIFDTNQRSDRLIQSCLAVCECAAVLDTDPELSPWAWYARAHHHYERSIFLLMEVQREPFGPHAERINRVLDHVFGATPMLGSRERSRSILKLLADEFDKMVQLRKIKNSQLTVSDNGSSSPNDHVGVVRTPDEGQQWNHWQPEVMYGQGYKQDLTAVSDDVWWPIPAQPGVFCGPTGPQHDAYVGPQHSDYYGLGSGHV